MEASVRSLLEGIAILPITLDIAVLTAQFPPDFPSDPMDRIIAATARAEGLPLVTADERILNCPVVKTIW
jgi:PIN domain nuclease of toxin-antitoxin system